MSESKIEKVHYKITNWKDYNQSLISRGNLELWFGEDILDQWAGQPNGRPGRPRRYSDLALQCMLALRVLYRLPLRATQGLFLSLLRMVDCPLDVPDYSTLCRRQGGLEPGLALTPSAEPRHILVDSTGLKVYGEGEWKVRTHGKGKRRTWRKLHLAVDADTREIVAMRLTEAGVGDQTAFPSLLLQVEGALRQVSADGIYDTWECRYEIHTRQASAVIPPRENAVETGCPEIPPAAERDEAVRAIAAHGSLAWRKASGYTQRSLAETTMFRFKCAFGERLLARQIQNQIAEAVMKSHILNRFIQEGLPISEPIV